MSPPRDQRGGPTERGERASKGEEHSEPIGGPTNDEPTGAIDRSGHEIANDRMAYQELSMPHEECGRGGVPQFDSLAEE